MDSSRPSTSYTTLQSLPPITALTSDLPPPEPSPGFPRHSLDPRDVRDSGNWSSQSKRKFSPMIRDDRMPRAVLVSSRLHSILLHLRSALPPTMTNTTYSRQADSSTISNTGGLQLQTILNHDDSPSRMSIPEPPHSARTGHHVRMLGPCLTNCANCHSPCLRSIPVWLAMNSSNVGAWTLIQYLTLAEAAWTVE